MNTIPISVILDRGATYLTNSQDAFVKKIALAQILVDSRAVKNIDAAILAFKIWAEPTARIHTAAVILSLANEKTK